MTDFKDAQCAIATFPTLRACRDGEEPRDEKHPVQITGAWNYPVKDRDGWKTEPGFVSVKAWGANGERLAKLTKGEPFMASGMLQVERWTDKDGNKREQLALLASVVSTLTWPPDSERRDDRDDRRDSRRDDRDRGRDDRREPPRDNYDETPF